MPTLHQRLPGEFCFVSLSWLIFYLGIIFVIYTTFGVSMYASAQAIPNLTSNARSIHSALALFVPFIWQPIASARGLI